MNSELVTKLLKDQFKYNESALSNIPNFENKAMSLIGICENEYNKANYHLNLYPEDTVEAKKMLFKAARGVEFDFWYYSGKYPQYKCDKANNRNINGMTNSGYVTFILCDHEEIFVSAFKQMQDFYNDKLGKNPWVAITYAFHHLIMGEIEEAKEKIGEHYRNKNEWGKGLANTLGGILHNDINLINTGIKHEIKQLVKYQNDIFDFSPKATALAKLALRFGFEPDVSSSFINKKMIIHENIDYEDIDDLFEALGVEPLTKYNLKNY